MRRHGGTPPQQDKQVTPAAISPPVLPGAALLGANSQV